MKTSEIISSKKSWKLILPLLGVVLGVLVIVSLVKFGTVFFFVPFWFWTVDKIINLTGANLWIARGLAALAVIPFFYLIKLIFSWKPEKRKVGWILLSVLMASLCFSMFFLSEDIYFSFKTGQAQKWYIVTPEGEYEFSDSPGYNTLWGIQYEKVTPAVIKKYIEQEKEETAGTTEDEKKEISPTLPKEVKGVVKAYNYLFNRPVREIRPKAVSKEPGSLVLSAEEEKLLVEELIKISPPWFDNEHFRILAILELLYETGNLSKHEGVLCNIMVTEALDGNLFGRTIIYYLAETGSEKSIPALLGVFSNARRSDVRELTKKAIKTIKDREEK